MTLTEPSEIPLELGSAAEHLRSTAAAVRVSFTWWGLHRSLSEEQKEEVGSTYAADARFVTAGKKIIDSRHETYRRLTSIRSRIIQYWRGLTLPYTEPGIRLIRQTDMESFVAAMNEFKAELTQAVVSLAAVYEDLKADARRRLGRLFNPADYPQEIQSLFAVEYEFPSV